MLSLGIAIALQLGRPLYESDALIYFKIATVLYDERSLSSYPIVSATAEGMYDPSAHPLGYLGTLIWSFMLADSPAPGAGKIAVFMASIATLVGLWVALQPHGAVTVMAAMLILITTPGYAAQMLGLGIDAHRLSLLLFTVLALVIAQQQQQQWRGWAVAGVVAGLALNSHAQMLLLVPAAVAATIGLAWDAPVTHRVVAMLIVGTSGLLVGGERYVLNLIEFGTPIYNDAPLFELLPSLDYHGWRFGLISRHDLWGRLSYGGLMGFTHWYFFGLSWWLCLLAIVFTGREVLACTMVRALLATILINFLILVLLFGFTTTGELLIGNYRYLLSLQPLVAALGGFLIGSLYELRASVC
jgi:hypothetical protein